MRFYVCSICVDRVFLTIHIPPWSSMGSEVLRICRSQRLDMGLKRVSWVRRYQGQCRALRPLGHQGYRLRNYKKDPPLCSGYSRATGAVVALAGLSNASASCSRLGLGAVCALVGGLAVSSDSEG